jgi:hypothetical protein
MSLLDDNLELVPGKDILAEICLKYFIEYGEHGIKDEKTSSYWTKAWNESSLTIEMLYKNKHKHYNEIINNPKKYILCIHRCYHKGSFERRLKIMDEDDLNKNSVMHHPCWDDFDERDDRGCTKYMTIDKILNKML